MVFFLASGKLLRKKKYSYSSTENVLEAGGASYFSQSLFFFIFHQPDSQGPPLEGEGPTTTKDGGDKVQKPCPKG